MLVFGGSGGVYVGVVVVWCVVSSTAEEGVGIPVKCGLYGLITDLL